MEGILNRMEIKIEKFFDIFEKKIRYFSSMYEFFHWYNCIKQYGAFDISKLETPIKVFYARWLRGRC